MKLEAQHTYSTSTAAREIMTPVMVIVDSNTERTVDLIHGNLYILFDQNSMSLGQSQPSHI